MEEKLVQGSFSARSGEQPLSAGRNTQPLLKKLLSDSFLYGTLYQVKKIGTSV